MDLYLIRHGIAVERGVYAVDGDRPLTPKGHKRTTAVAQRLKAQGLRFDLILTSPLVRASQTAEILHTLDLSPNLEINPCLSPDGSLEDWLIWLQHWRSRTKRTQEQPSLASSVPHSSAQSKTLRDRPPTTPALALVGHEPNLGEWAEQLLWGRHTTLSEEPERLIVKKAGVLGLHLPDQGSPLGQSQLFWLTPPRLLLSR